MEQFEYWKTSLEESIAALRASLAAVPREQNLIVEHFDIMMIDYEAVVKFEDSRSSKFDYTTALPSVRTAQQLKAQVERILAASETRNSQTPHSTSTAPRRKLPELIVPIFTGKFADYPSFKKVFKLKHEDSGATGAENLVHLQNNVTGEPKLLIGKLTADDANYNVAFAALDAKYSKPDQILSELHAAIEALPVAKDSTESLKNVFYQLEGHLTALKAHGEGIDTNTLLRDKVYAKYPVNIVCRVTDEELLMPTDFQNAISKYLSLRASIEGARRLPPAVEEKPKALTAALAASVFESQTPPPPPKDKRNPRDRANRKPTCAFCTEKHYSGECRAIVTLSGRKNALKDKCIVCFSSEHKKPCPRSYTCGLCKKKNDHARAICPLAFDNDQPKAGNSSASSSTGTVVPPIPTKPNTAARTLNFAAQNGGAHTTLICSLLHPTTNREYRVRAILDNGCNNTYISRDFARRAGLQILSTTTLSISVFLHSNPIKTECGQTIATLTNGTDFHKAVQLDTLPAIPQDCVVFDYDQFKRSHPEYSHLNFVPQNDEQEVELVIGSDVFWSLLLPQSKITVHEDCYLYETVFGWALVGRVNHFAQHSIFYATTPKQAIDKLTSLDALGVHDLPRSEIEEEERALQSFYRELKYIDNRYQIRWPWRSYPPDLKNNFALALGRLRSLYNNLDEDSFNDYDRIIRNQMEQGIVEKVPVNEINNLHAHYLPHKAIFTPEKSTKLRIVYDGSARLSRTSKSLNDAIYKGSNLLNNLVALVLKFRLRQIVILADVEKAFLQISLAPPDRNYVRFLWTDKFEPPLSNKDIVAFRFTRVAFGVNAAPFLMNATFEHHIENNPNEFTEQLKENRYADNFSFGVEDAETGYRLYLQAKELFKKCSMNLRSWATNSPELRAQFAAEDREEESVISVLGTEWDAENDTIKIKDFSPATAFSLRGVLSSVSSFYDVLGLFAPLHVRAKLFIQDAHLSHKTWNEPIHSDFVPRWEEIESDYAAAVNMEFPRLLVNPQDANCKGQLHVFADASARAIAAVAYLRTRIHAEPFQIHLLCAKTKIVKPNVYTIPKLELMAVLLATKVLKFARSVICRDSDACIWSDSKCALNWIKSTGKILPVFVKNRVKQIRECPRVSFRYVPTEDNPADIPSRGSALSNLQPNSLWWQGPSWLATQMWPEDCVNFDDAVYANIDDEINTEYEQRSILAAITNDRLNYIPPFGIDQNFTNDLMPLLRRTACCIRLLQLKFPRKEFAFQKYANRPITQAELMWVKAEQNFHFADVLIALRTKKRNELVHRLGLFLDENEIIRCAHRLKNSALQYREKFPILLPRAKLSHFTCLIIRHFHVLVYHQGTSYTLAAVRREYWIPAGRAAVSSVVTACGKCKRYTTRSFRQPDESQLPSFRLEISSSPFKNIGIDTCGPLIIENSKYWIVIFVDLVCRAVDLELLADMTAEELLFAFRCVAARRTLPSFIVSDNAKQFQLLNTLFSATLSNDFIWKFIPDFSQWQGGVYERQIKIVKQSLNRTFHGSVLSCTAVRTALAEIAAMLNDRPLTYVSEDGEDRPLTPNDFLQSRYVLPTEIKLPENATATASQIVAIWKQSQEATRAFWDSWSSSYLQSLRTERRPYVFPRATSKESPREGMVVLIGEKVRKRASWRIGRILQLNVSADGQVRSATLKLGNRKLPKNNGKWDFACEIITRPLSMLYPLELAENVLPPDSQLVHQAQVIAPAEVEEVEEIELQLDDEF